MYVLRQDAVFISVGGRIDTSVWECREPRWPTARLGRSAFSPKKFVTSTSAGAAIGSAQLPVAFASAGPEESEPDTATQIKLNEH